MLHGSDRLEVMALLGELGPQPAQHISDLITISPLIKRTLFRNVSGDAFKVICELVYRSPDPVNFRDLVLSTGLKSLKLKIALQDLIAMKLVAYSNFDCFETALYKLVPRFHQELLERLR